MHINTARGQHLEIFDANGVRLEWVVECNLETGWALHYKHSEITGLVMTLGDEVWKEHRHHPWPLRAFTVEGVEVKTELDIWVTQEFRKLKGKIDRRFEAMREAQECAFDRIEDQIVWAWAQTSHATWLNKECAKINGVQLEVGSRVYIPLAQVERDTTRNAEMAMAYGKYIMKKVRGERQNGVYRYSEPHTISEPTRLPTQAEVNR